jgi:hypothetical protein
VQVERLGTILTSIQAYREEFDFTLNRNENINIIVANFAESIIRAADVAIPKIDTTFKSKIPYWDQEFTWEVPCKSCKIKKKYLFLS